MVKLVTDTKGINAKSAAISSLRIVQNSDCPATSILLTEENTCLVQNATTPLISTTIMNCILITNVEIANVII